MQLHDLKYLIIYLFNGDLGDYTRPDGSIVKAISIVPPEPQGNYQTTGIEAVIREPEDNPHLLLGGRYVSNERFLVVTFIQHDRTASLHNLSKLIMSRLIPNFPGGNLTHMPPNGNVLEQINVRLFDPEMVEVKR